MALNAEYWDNRYVNDETAWDAGAITTPLKAYFDQVRDKTLRILIPGAGNAHEAEYLFHQGFKNVFVLDYSAKALYNFSERNPGFPTTQLVHEDFFAHKGQYDLIIEQTFFCAIDPKLRSEYATHMNELLSPKGKLVGVLFNDVLNKDVPPFGGNTEEYKGYFESYFNFHVFEPCYNSIKPRAERELFINLIKK
jgi:thiopurine S-methyltransferase